MRCTSFLLSQNVYSVMDLYELKHVLALGKKKEKEKSDTRAGESSLCS